MVPPPLPHRAPRDAVLFIPGVPLPLPFSSSSPSSCDADCIRASSDSLTPMTFLNFPFFSLSSVTSQSLFSTSGFPTRTSSLPYPLLPSRVFIFPNLAILASFPLFPVVSPLLPSFPVSSPREIRQCPSPIPHLSAASLFPITSPLTLPLCFFAIIYLFPVTNLVCSPL